MVVAVTGGYNGNQVLETEFLDLASKQWQQGPTLPIGRKRLQISEADSLSNKVLALQRQVIKARVLEWVVSFIYLLVHSSFHELFLSFPEVYFLNWPNELRRIH